MTTTIGAARYFTPAATPTAKPASAAAPGPPCSWSRSTASMPRVSGRSVTASLRAWWA